jgi:hypothetical protein
MALTLNGTTGIAGANGSASTPAVQGEDTNTGVFFPAADTVAVATGGSERMRVDSAGNVGIGITSPGARLEVYQAGEAASLRINNPTTTGFSTVVFMEDSSARGQIWGGNSSYSSYGGAGSLNYSANSGPHVWYTNYTERARIDSSGNLLVGTTSSLVGDTHSFINAGSTQFALRNSNATAGRFWQVGMESTGTFLVYNNNNTGVYLTYGGTSWSANSDERMKTTLVPFEDAVGKVCSLRSGTGRYLTDEEDVSRSFLIAQDVQAVLPEAVDVQGDEQGTLGLRYTDVVPLLVAAIKELKAEVDSLKAQLEAN